MASNFQRLNLHPSAAYLSWYLPRVHHARHNLGTSFMDQVTPQEWGLSVRDLALHHDPDELIRAVARQYGVAPAQVVPAVGTSAANLHLFDLLLRPGDHVLLEQPVYEPIWRALESRKVKVTRFPRRMEDGFAVDFDALKRSITRRTRLIVITSLHNPSGVALPPETLKEIGRIAKRYGAFVLCDEVYSDFQRPGTWQPAAAIGPHMISTNSFSKFFGLYGLRIGWALCAKPLADAANHIKETSTPPWSEPSVRLALKAFRDMTWLRRRAQERIRANWPVMDQWLQAHPQFDCVRPTAGVICFIKHRRRFNDLAFADHLLKRYRTAVTPGTFFEMPGGLRVGFATPPAAFCEALSRLTKGLQEFEG